MTSTPARGPVYLFMLVLLAPIAATRQAHGHSLDAGARPFSPFAPMPCPRSAVPPPKFCAYVLWVGAACSNRCAAAHQAHDHGLDASATTGYILTPTPMAGLDTGQAQAPTDDFSSPQRSRGEPFRVLPPTANDNLHYSQQPQLPSTPAMMRMMYRSRSLADEEMRPASPPGKPGANSMLLVPDLRPLRMWPCHYAKAADAVGYLKAIEHVEA
ncbi:hypothetical protein PF003_g25110 [Phytophthora fragariae]|nr:hypothetical protein PF003_g25110 [Phytophthora fragariae]